MASNAQVTVTTAPVLLSVNSQSGQSLTVSAAPVHAVSLTVAQRGPAGDGGGGSGVTYLTDSRPAGAEKEMWFNDLTQTLQIHDGTEWLGINHDGGYF